jgi:hypothetical protein
MTPHSVHSYSNVHATPPRLISQYTQHSTTPRAPALAPYTSILPSRTTTCSNTERPKHTEPVNSWTHTSRGLGTYVVVVVITDDVLIVVTPGQP